MATVSILNLLTGSSSPLLASGDVLPFVDISDTTQSASGSTVKATLTQFFAAIPVPIVITSASANALAVGLAGATNPALQVDASTALQAAGLKVTGAVAAGTVALAVISSSGNANLSIDAKGSGTVTIGATSTGAITLSRATMVTSAGTSLTSNTTAAQANFNAVFKASRSSSTFWWLALDASDQFTLLNAAGNANNLVVTDAGALTVRAGVTATTGTFTTSVTTPFGAFGTTPADTGAVRIPNAQWIYARNAANGGNVGIAQVDSSDSLSIGAGASSVSMAVRVLLAGAATAGSGSDVYLGGSTQTTIGANGGASALTALPLGYLIAYKGATKIVIPYYNG